MSSTTTSSSGGIGFAGLLTILFIGLKLGGVIDWSWWWVLSPILISWALALFVLAVVGSVLLTRAYRAPVLPVVLAWFVAIIVGFSWLASVL